MTRRALSIAAVLACLPAATSAQSGRVALDVLASVDADVGSTVPRVPAGWLDVFGAVRLVEGLDVRARPVVFRRTFNGEWQPQLYELGIRYERPGRVGVRLNGGVMPSPIGLGMLENRQDLNPVVSQHSAYYLPLPRVDPEIPRTFLIAGTYPLGAQLTLAAKKWDARVALIDASPVRGRPFIGSDKPPQLPNWVSGFGMTPIVGLRLGAAVAHGPYARQEEVVDQSLGDRTATMVQVEGEWSFDYTRIAGELVRSTIETSRAEDAVPAGGWIEITQTLHPRVFLAGRADAQEIGFSRQDGTRSSQSYFRYEAVVGFRVTPDFTLRAGYLTRHGYVVFHWDDQFVMSATFQKRLF